MREPIKIPTQNPSFRESPIEFMGGNKFLEAIFISQLCIKLQSHILANRHFCSFDSNLDNFLKLTLLISAQLVVYPTTIMCGKDVKESKGQESIELVRLDKEGKFKSQEKQFAMKGSGLELGKSKPTQAQGSSTSQASQGSQAGKGS